ncbi:hypothetical protein NDN08_006086 [Rhodosorus marinus]|uniref:Anaphase-promoting complex subunit 4 WD40 domain-containing protein n=1 Tax=Rhodosorus marinus TaxID=101924 RepID=A0AAV8UJT3_9RHOD|nr:hypothetical protein NDN08_006086 [Rhodosorus marinus]
MKVILDEDGSELSIESNGNSHSTAGLILGACKTGISASCWHPTRQIFAVASCETEDNHEFHKPSERYRLGECSVDLWEVVERNDEPSAKKIGSCKYPGACVYDVSFSPNGQLLAVVTASGDVYLRSYEGGSRLSLPENVESQLVGEDPLIQWRLSWCPNENQLAVGCFNGSVIMWNIENGRNWISQAHTSAIRCIRFREDGELFATAGHDGRIKVWNTGRPLVPVADEKLGLLWLLSIEWISDREIAVAADDGFVRVVSFVLEKGRASSSSVVCHSGSVWDLSFFKKESLDRSEILSCGSDGAISMFTIGESVALQSAKRNRRHPSKPPRRLLTLAEAPEANSAPSEDQTFKLTYQSAGPALVDRSILGKHNRTVLELPLSKSKALTNLHLSSPIPIGVERKRYILATGAQGLFLVAVCKSEVDEGNQSSKPKRARRSTTGQGSSSLPTADPPRRSTKRVTRKNYAALLSGTDSDE